MATAIVQTPVLDYSSLGASAHTFSHAEETTNEKTLQGFPAQYANERVWTGSEMLKKQDEWVTVLTAEEQSHIVNALRHFQGLKLGPDAITTETFPLPAEIHNRLRSISHALYEGRGFGVVRGVDPSQFTAEENVLVYAGISAHIAPLRGFQDIYRETVIYHVVSEETKQGAGDQDLRPAFTNERLAFHTDVGEILALYAMEISGSGGETMIVSSSQIYNELAKQRPDLLQELGKPWAFFHAQDYGQNRTPLLTNVAHDKLVFQFSRLPITGFRGKGANPTLPSTTAKRLEAMLLVEEIARKHAFCLPRHRGDMVYINNMCLMHARNSFDKDEAGKPLPSKRHLVKFMLRDPELTWQLPEYLDWYVDFIYGANAEDGARREKWQVTIDDDDTEPEKRTWAGTNCNGNG